MQKRGGDKDNLINSKKKRRGGGERGGWCYPEKMGNWYGGRGKGHPLRKKKWVHPFFPIGEGDPCKGGREGGG